MYARTHTHTHTKSIGVVLLKLCLSSITSITYKITTSLSFKKPSRSKVTVSIKNLRLHDLQNYNFFCL